MNTESPSLFIAHGNPMSGVPLSLAERAFLTRFSSVVVGNGVWPGPAAAGSANGWTMTDVGTGTGALALNSAGALVLTGGTTDEDVSSVQLLTLPMRYSLTNDLWFFARVACSTAITTDALIGLAPADTSLVATTGVKTLTNTDGLYFWKEATATDWAFQVRKSSTSTSTPMGLTLTNAAYALLGFRVSGGIIQAFAALDPNDSVKNAPPFDPAMFGAAKVPVLDNAPLTSTDLFPTFLVGQEGGTTARTVTIPWAMWCQAHA